MAREIQNMFSLEAPDGAGKTTQIPLIKSALEEKGYKVKVLKSPDVTPLGEFIRKNVRQLNPWVRNRLFLLDMNNSLKSINDDPKKVYLWDRYTDSFYTSNKEMTRDEASKLVAHLPKPVKTFLLDIEAEYIFSERKATLDHHSDPDWIEQKVARYRELYNLEPDRFLKVDARLPIPVITEMITLEIDKLMKEIYG